MQFSSYIEVLDDRQHVEASQRGLRFQDEVDKGPAEPISIDTDRIPSIDTNKPASIDTTTSPLINTTASPSIDTTTSSSIDTGRIVSGNPECTAHRPTRPARYRSTALQIQRSIVSSLCRMIALAIDR
ncbi:hypothetical protein F2Q69_00005922 [Brassica cretica]|uniref:Uncharacterized protein n=1 Tax=Brassica cretica TaxID=69181 RepID=A0A8S9P663_BRACR|nr:hypothetical protein F2Q69_00005922 [Brassica cretica]